VDYLDRLSATELVEFPGRISGLEISGRQFLESIFVADFRANLVSEQLKIIRAELNPGRISEANIDRRISGDRGERISGLQFPANIPRRISRPIIRAGIIRAWLR
jgi:hypothetical protein